MRVTALQLPVIEMEGIRRSHLGRCGFISQLQSHPSSSIMSRTRGVWHQSLLQLEHNKKNLAQYRHGKMHGTRRTLCGALAWTVHALFTDKKISMSSHTLFTDKKFLWARIHCTIGGGLTTQFVLSGSKVQYSVPHKCHPKESKIVYLLGNSLPKQLSRMNYTLPVK